MQDKAELRQALISMRQAVAPATRAQWDEAIGKQISDWLATHPVQTLGVYWPIRAEPDLRNFYADWMTRGVRLALPVVIDKDAALKFYTWEPGIELTKDAMGVMVPHAHSPQAWPDVILIPCVGYNDLRLRLGYGGGFYDRTLALAPRPQALGVAYSCTRAAFDGAAHDIALDAIVTEKASASLW